MSFSSIEGLKSIKGKNKYYVTGKDIFSTLLPEDLDLEYKAKICLNCDVCTAPNCPNDAHVIIKKGVLKQGTVDENSIGAFKGRILDRIIRDHGMGAGREFIDKVTRLGIASVRKSDRAVRLRCPGAPVA